VLRDPHPVPLITLVPPHAPPLSAEKRPPPQRPCVGAIDAAPPCSQRAGAPVRRHTLLMREGLGSLFGETND